MSNDFTDRQFWKAYWESKPNLAIPIKKNYVFHKLLKQIIMNNDTKSAIELGGFPGYYALFLKKYFNINSTLFDYYIDGGILQKVLAKNGLSESDVKIIEADVFNYKPGKQYDLVLSCGLIEHFEDTKDIISRHVQFLAPNGTLFITLPNFTGVNGWVQRKFDRSNYEKHNIRSMDPEMLADVCKALGLKEVRSMYYGNFSVWLENKSDKSVLVKLIVRSMWIAGKSLTTLFPFNSKLLSPYIVVSGKR